MELKAEDRLILSCVKIQPGATELDQLNKLIPLVQDWEYLTKNIINRGIGPLLYKKLPLLTNSSFIPERVKTKLQQAYYKTIGRGTVLQEHFRKVGEAFAAQCIAVIALKGIYLSEWLYQDIGLRQFSDIDLLVKEEDGLKCLSILQELGFRPFDSGETEFVKSKVEIIHYTPMILNGISIEIHIKLHRNKEKYDLKVDELWKNAIPATINNTPVYALNNYDLLIHLCLHLNKHFRGGHVQFTCFNDITNLLDKYSGGIDWIKFIETCRNYNCEAEVFRYIVLVNKYMNAPVPTEIIQQYDSLLTPNDEKLFFEYLAGKFVPFSAVPQHFGNLGKISSLSDKFKYVWDILFPSKAFMIQTYKIKRSSRVLLYYPYRYYIGVRGVVNYLFRK